MISPLRDLLRDVLERAGIETASELWQIGNAWERAVGRTIAAHAQPAGLRRGELLVASPDAVWRQELSLLAPDIKNKVNAALGRDVVARVRIVAGTVAAPDEPAPRRRGGARGDGGGPRSRDTRRRE